MWLNAWFIGLTWFNHPRWCRISQPSIVSWIFLYFDVVLSQEVFIATSSLQFTSPLQHAIETGFDLALEKAQGWERMAQFIFITCHSYVIYPLQLTLHNHSSILSVLLSWNNDFEVQMIIIQYIEFFMQFYCIPWYSPYFQPNLPVFFLRGARASEVPMIGIALWFATATRPRPAAREISRNASHWPSLGDETRWEPWKKYTYRTATVFRFMYVYII